MKGRISYKHFKNSLSYGFPISVHHMSVWLMTYVSSIMIAFFYNQSLLGIFAIAVKIYLPATFVVDALSNAYNPIYYKLRSLKEDKSKEIEELNQVYFIIAIFTVFMMIWFSKSIVLLLFSIEYSRIIEFISLICLSIIFNTMYRLKVATVFYQKKTKLVPKITILSGSLGLIASYFSIKELGLIEEV